MSIPANTLKIAVVDSNVLSCLGLRRILEKVVPMASVVMIDSFEHLVDSDIESFMHFFVSSAIYFEHVSFFQNGLFRFIVLVNGDGGIRMPGVLKLNICQSEDDLVNDILKLHHHGHGNGPHSLQHEVLEETDFKSLSPREIEVAVLLVRGYINKEIADKLSISLPTVISHRKNIMEKLGAKSLSDIAIFAVVHGYVEIGDI